MVEACTFGGERWFGLLHVYLWLSNVVHHSTNIHYQPCNLPPHIITLTHTHCIRTHIVILLASCYQPAPAQVEEDSIVFTMVTNDRAVHHDPPCLHAESVHRVSSVRLLEQRRLTMGYTSLTSLNSDKVYLADELQTSHVRKIRAVWQVESEPPDSTQRASRGVDTKHIVVRSTVATKRAVRSATAEEQGAGSPSAVLHGTDGVRATAAVLISHAASEGAAQNRGSRMIRTFSGVRVRLPCAQQDRTVAVNTIHHDCGAERGLPKETRENNEQRAGEKGEQSANEKSEAPLPQSRRNPRRLT